MYAWPPQLPFVHTSSLVHAFPSSQLPVLFAKLHVPSPLHVPVPSWHWFGEAQVYAWPPQLPFVHTSSLVHAFPSSQLPVLLAKLHVPSPLHVPVPSWHWFGEAQVYAWPPQLPFVHTSSLVHAFPSLQLPVLFAKLHVPSPLHVPVPSWHWFGEAQVYAWPPQLPFVHTSSLVHAFPSLQLPVLFAKLHVPSPLHVPVPSWHWFGEAQVYAWPPQLPFVHTSSLVHAFPSLQLPVLFAKLHVPSPLHVPVPSWHWFGEAQVYAWPPQLPFVHTSSLVHAFPSLQLPVLFAKLHVPSPLHVPVPSWHWFGEPQVYAWPPQLPFVHTSSLVHAFPSSQVPVLGA